MQQQISRAFKRGAAAEADEVFVDQLLLARGEPGDVESQRGKTAVQIVKLGARKHAERQWRQRLDRVLHLAHQRALQADHVGGQRVIENLAATVIEHLVTERPAAQHRVEIFAVRAFAQEARAGIDAQLVDLELLHKVEFILVEFAQAGALAQRTLLARRIGLAVEPSISHNHWPSPSSVSYTHLTLPTIYS